MGSDPVTAGATGMFGPSDGAVAGASFAAGFTLAWALGAFTAAGFFTVLTLAFDFLGFASAALAPPLDPILPAVLLPAGPAAGLAPVTGVATWSVRAATSPLSPNRLGQ